MPLYLLWCVCRWRWRGAWCWWWPRVDGSISGTWRVAAPRCSSETRRSAHSTGTGWVFHAYLKIQMKLFILHFSVVLFVPFHWRIIFLGCLLKRNKNNGMRRKYWIMTYESNFLSVRCFLLFLNVWIRIRNKIWNTDPDLQSCWIRIQFRSGSTTQHCFKAKSIETYYFIESV